MNLAAMAQPFRQRPIENHGRRDRDLAALHLPHVVAAGLPVAVAVEQVATRIGQTERAGTRRCEPIVPRFLHLGFRDDRRFALEFTVIPLWCRTCVIELTGAIDPPSICLIAGIVAAFINVDRSPPHGSRVRPDARAGTTWPAAGRSREPEPEPQRPTVAGTGLTHDTAASKACNDGPLSQHSHARSRPLGQNAGLASRRFLVPDREARPLRTKSIGPIFAYRVCRFRPAILSAAKQSFEFDIFDATLPPCAALPDRIPPETRQGRRPDPTPTTNRYDQDTNPQLIFTLHKRSVKNFN